MPSNLEDEMPETMARFPMKELVISDLLAKANWLVEITKTNGTFGIHGRHRAE